MIFMEGRFITIYGINNIGKSTQAKILVQRLMKEGYKAVHIKYPGYDLEPTGPEINQILRSKGGQEISEEKLQSLFTRNRKDYQHRLEELISAGNIVIAEDYTGTGIAWGTAKGLSREWLENLNAKLLREDMAVLITGKRIISSRENNHIHESNDDLVIKVDHELRELAKFYSWIIVEQQPAIEQTAEKMFRSVIDFLKNSGCKPVK